MRSIRAAAQFFPEEDAADILPPAPAADPLAPRTVVYGGSEPLSARPAARLARIATGFDAQVTINDVDAGSVLALMGLKVQPGQELRIAAEGGESRRALDAVEAELTDANAPWPEEIATDQMPEPEAVTQLREAAAQTPELSPKAATEESNATSENILPPPPDPHSPLDSATSSKFPQAPAASDTPAPAAESAELIKRIGVGPLPVSLEK
ncbi:HPr family phosphocarrier protein [Varibaculum cambriense]|nr:HPr family phosphocarrier protein [Varibaculum cambriense]